MVMYDKDCIGNTLEESHMTEYLKQAQKAEFRELTRIISENHDIDLLDIGVGDARIPISLSKSEDIWDRIRKYDGIDNSPKCIDSARKNIQKEGLDNKVEVITLEAKDIPSLGRKYDLIICTYFTAGNFYPDTFSFETGLDGQLVKVPDLKRNEAFQQVFRAAYDSLNQDGELVLGSAYVDNEDTRRRQEEFYKKCGMEVISSKNHSFTATKEGFWSQRFTHDKIRDYFNWVNPRQIQFIPLDSYNFAEMIRIKK